MDSKASASAVDLLHIDHFLKVCWLLGVVVAVPIASSTLDLLLTAIALSAVLVWASAFL